MYFMRVLKLRRHLKRLPTGRFNMGVLFDENMRFMLQEEPVMHTCGSVGCVAGHCLDVFPKNTSLVKDGCFIFWKLDDKKFLKHRYDSFVSELLGISLDDAYALTNYEYYANGEVTTQDVIKKLDDYIIKELRCVLRNTFRRLCSAPTNKMRKFFTRNTSPTTESENRNSEL